MINSQRNVTGEEKRNDAYPDTETNMEETELHRKGGRDKEILFE